MGFSDHSLERVSSTRATTPGLEFLPRNSQKAEKFEKLVCVKSIDLDELRKLSWSGVPSDLRARVWRILTGYVPPVGDVGKVQECLDRKRDEYRSLVSEYYPKREDDQYRDTFRQIHIDVPRMCPLIPLFQQIIVQVINEILYSEAVWTLV
jgi:TBC1 domain family member 2